MLKVIGGKYRSRNLLTPGEETIPTKARVREAVASALSFAIPNAEVLDLFAGSGALGIEMLSRGAKRCVFVDVDPDAAKVIRDRPYRLVQLVPFLFFSCIRHEGLLYARIVG